MVFPLSDDNSDRTSFPIVTVALIVINVVVFVLFQGMGANEDFTYAYATVPLEIKTGRDIVEQEPEVHVDPTTGQRFEAPPLRRTPIPVYLTLLTAVFMHGGLAHLGGNMWFLWIFGDNIEQDLGRVRYLIFYLLCGLLASLAHVLTNLNSTTPCLGASGAISGVMGAYLVMHPHRKVTVLLFRFMTVVPGYVAVGIWFAFQVVSGLGMLGGESGGVAYGAHIGGFVAGAALIKPFAIGRPRTDYRRSRYEDDTETFWPQR